MNVISPFDDKLVKYIKYNKLIIFNNTRQADAIYRNPFSFNKSVNEQQKHTKLRQITLNRSEYVVSEYE